MKVLNTVNKEQILGQLTTGLTCLQKIKVHKQNLRWTEVYLYMAVFQCPQNVIKKTLVVNTVDLE